MKNERPQIENLLDEYIEMRKVCDSPIFIVTTNDSISIIDKQIVRRWTGGRFYELQKSSESLYDDIKEAVENNEDYILRKKYEIIFDFYSKIQDSKSDELLLGLLKSFH